MKYIRLFENIQDKIDSLKDFIIVDFTFKIRLLLVVEIINRTPLTISYKYKLYDNNIVKRHYNIDKNPKFFEVPKDNYQEWLDKIVYQTDTLQDAVDMLPILNTSDKYNL